MSFVTLCSVTEKLLKIISSHLLSLSNYVIPRHPHDVTSGIRNVFYIQRRMFVCLCGSYTNSHFWTDLNQTLYTSPPWSGRDRRVCMDPKFLTSSTFWALFLWGELQNHGHKMAAGATVFRDTLISVIPADVRVTSPTWSCRKRRSHPRQPYIRDSSGSFSNVAEMTS